MRVKAMFLGDVRFQFKYGFYYIYLFFPSYISACCMPFPCVETDGCDY